MIILSIIFIAGSFAFVVFALIFTSECRPVQREADKEPDQPRSSNDSNHLHPR